MNHPKQHLKVSASPPNPPAPTRAKRIMGRGATQIKIMQDDSLRYRYELTLHTPGEYFECSLLSEVGEPYLPEFQFLLAMFNIVVAKDMAEYDERPWYADKLGSCNPA